MGKLEHDFEVELHNSCRDAANIVFYPSSRFLQMLDRYGAVGTAKKLVRSGIIHRGLKKLKAAGYLNLSLEYIMTSSHFSSLFEEEDIQAAKWRLSVIDVL